MELDEKGGATPASYDSYRLRRDATVDLGDDGALTLRVSRYRLGLDDLSAARRAAVLRLTEEWTTDQRIGELVTALEGESQILRVQVLIRGLLAHSWLDRRIHADDGRPLLELAPHGLGANSLPTPATHTADASYRLSRFALLRTDGDQLIAETPLAALAVAIPAPAVVAALSLATRHTGLTRAGFAAESGLEEALAGRLLDELLAAHVLVSAADAEAEAAKSPLAPWSPMELAMHNRARPGRHVLPVGGTYPLRDRIAPEPLARDFDVREKVRLPETDLKLTAKTDPSLTAVVEARRTIRRHDPDSPITSEQLAEFLYRVQRTVSLGSEGGTEVAKRPYPAGGALHELEVYPVVHRCADLESGVYHYESIGHQLERLGPLGADARKALDYVSAAAALTEPPQIYLVITARVGRVMWKYEGFGYSLVLKHAGVLTELMYLTATAMGLAPCAVGAGDAAAFARAAGVDSLAEPSVADFVLGTMPATSEVEGTSAS